MRSLRGVPEDEKASRSILTAVKFDETSIQNESDFSHLFTKVHIKPYCYFCVYMSSSVMINFI